MHWGLGRYDDVCRHAQPTLLTWVLRSNVKRLYIDGVVKTFIVTSR